MPVDVKLQKEGMLYQREQYQKGGVGRWYWDFRDKAVLKCLDDNKTIVDIGCGEGLLMEKVAKRFPAAKIIGIDPSPENVAICESYNLDVFTGSVYELPFDNKSVDSILFIEVIEHLDYPDFALKEIQRVLKQDGKLVLLFPHDSVFKLARILTFKFREAFYDAGHVKQWHPAEITKILKQCGFQIILRKIFHFIYGIFYQTAL